MKDVATRTIVVHLFDQTDTGVVHYLELPATADLRPHRLAGCTTVPVAITRAIREQFDVVAWLGYTYDAATGSYTVALRGYELPIHPTD